MRYTELAQTLFYDVGNPATRSFPRVLASTLTELMQGLESDHERLHASAAIAQAAIGTPYDTAELWTQLLGQLPQTIPEGHDSSGHPMDRLGQAMARSCVQQPDHWLALISHLPGGGGASQRAQALARTMALAGVADPSVWSALVDCAVRHAPNPSDPSSTHDPHTPETDAGHAARLSLARSFTDSGITCGPAWAALFKAASPLPDAQRDELLGALYQCNPDAGTLHAVAAALPPPAALLRHMLARASTLKPDVLWAALQFAQATELMSEVPRALAAQDDTTREATVRALEATMTTPRQLTPAHGIRGGDHDAHPAAVWIDLLRWISDKARTRALVGRLALATTSQPGWATTGRLQMLVGALCDSGAPAQVWETLLHRLGEPQEQHLGFFAQVMCSAGVSDPGPWRELRERAQELEPEQLRELIARLQRLPATSNPRQQAAAAQLTALTSTLARQSDLLVQGNSMSAGEWALQYPSLLDELIPSDPTPAQHISPSRAQALARLLLQRRVTDPAVWARLLRHVPGDSFHHGLGMLDLVADYLGETGLAAHPDVAPELERMITAVEVLAPSLTRAQLEQQLDQMSQQLTGRPYAACVQALTRKASVDSIDTLVNLVSDICRRAPAVVMAFWRTYMNCVMLSRDIDLVSRCLLQARHLLTLRQQYPEQIDATRLELARLQHTLGTLLEHQKSSLDTADFIIAMEAMDPATQAAALHQLIEAFLQSAPRFDMRVGQASKLFGRSVAVFLSVKLPGARTSLDCVHWWVAAGHIEGVVNALGKAPELMDGPITRYLCGKVRKSTPATLSWLDTIGKYLGREGKEKKATRSAQVDEEIRIYLASLLVDLPRDVIAQSATLQWLGPLNLLGMVHSLGRLDSPGSYTGVFCAVMRNMATAGRLRLDSIPAVQRHRQLLRDRAPHVRWDTVFHPSEHPDMPVLTVQTAGATARMATGAVLDALHTLTVNLMAWAKDAAARPDLGASRHTARHRSGDNALVHGFLKPLLGLIGGSTRKTTKATAAALWGSQWEQGPGTLQVRVDKGMASALCSDPFDSLCTDLIHALGELPEDMSGPLKAQAEQVKALARHLRTLGHLPGTGTMNSSSSYRIALRDPEDPASLLHCQTTGGCLQPGSAHFRHMLERLAGWIVWTAVDDSGTTCAAAWGTLNERGELVVDFVDALRTDPKEATSEMVKALLDYGPMLKRHLGITGPVWVGPPQYGRLTHLDVFDRPTITMKFWSLAPSFGRSVRDLEHSLDSRPLIDDVPGDYSDAVNKGEKNYFKA